MFSIFLYGKIEGISSYSIFVYHDFLFCFLKPFLEKKYATSTLSINTEWVSIFKRFRSKKNIIFGTLIIKHLQWSNRKCLHVTNVISTNYLLH